jgi:hypothetical protein
MTHMEVKYNAAHAEDFGGILLGEGYMINNSGSTAITVSYEGAPDGLPDSEGVGTDMWISLPGGSMHWMGNPFYHSVGFDQIMVTDGTQTLRMASAVSQNWLSGTWTTLDGQTQEETTVGLASLNPDDSFLRPTHMYKVQTYRQNLAVIIPCNAVPEPSSLLALFGGLVGLGGFALRRRR